MIAWLLSRPRVFNWLRKRAMRTPYSPIWSRDGSVVYMQRYWLFNPYPRDEMERLQRGWLRNVWPSIRLHHILHADDDPHLHDHPWNARTFILDGCYIEQLDDAGHACTTKPRVAGDTFALKFNQFHRIEQVSPGGVWTMFVTWKYRGTWGFRVNGVKVPYREYFEGRDNGTY